MKLNSPFLIFFIEKLPLLLEKTGQQLYLASLALIIAILIGVPLGLWIARREKVRSLIIGFANILQTIPSLAVLVFLLPFLGIGIKPAIVALSIYALLPIIRNTVAGVQGISFGMMEAADSLGFSRWQRLWMIELPLALPVIVAGVRTAAAMSIGIATLAAFIGAGGLGDFIYEGLSLNDNRLVLLGAVPAGILALLVDFIIGRIEKLIVTKKYRVWKKYPGKILGLSSAIMVIVFFISMSGFFYYQKSSFDVIRIGSKNFTEQLILSELMAQIITHETHLQVDRKFNLGGTLLVHDALVHGDLDLYPEYTGTAYLAILQQHDNKQPEQIYQVVRNLYQQRFHLVWLAPFGFSNSNALVVREDFAKHNHLTNISDVIPLADQLTLGISADGLRRADGLPGLQKAYGLNFARVKLMEPTVMYAAIKHHKIDAMIGFATDGQISANHLIILKDDKHFYPSYYAAPVVREMVLRDHPELLKPLQLLAGVLNERVMQELNYAVDEEKQSPEKVAHAFLLSRGLIE